jgi:hypothetical protein
VELNLEVVELSHCFGPARSETLAVNVLSRPSDPHIRVLAIKTLFMEYMIRNFMHVYVSICRECRSWEHWLGFVRLARKYKATWTQKISDFQCARVYLSVDSMFIHCPCASFLSHCTCTMNHDE